jgi:hypothetical protein
MQLNSTRYIFTYITPPDEVEDFIRRSDDLAAQTYGRDKFFSRLNQALEQARFLGWPLPRFGPNLPEELTEIPPSGVDHIFENQAKLLVDVAPVTRVMLQDGRYCPVRMVCGTTAAGDLVWRCHLLIDKDGAPYVQRNNKQYKVKTKGTKIICQTESLPYDDEYMIGCFGGDEGLWPVPFLPEFFSDQPIALKFSPEQGVVEVVRIHEEEPVHVFAKEIVPWYRPLEIDRTKALTFDAEEYSGAYPPAPRIHKNSEQPNLDTSLDHLVEGWDDMSDDEKFDITDEREYDDGEDLEDEDEDIRCIFVNVSTSFSNIESKHLKGYDATLENSHIASKEEAEDLRKDPEHKDRAEGWLLAAVNRLRLLANYSEKIGAVISIVEKNRDHQILIIQPRQKWATKLVEVLTQRGIKAELYDPKNRSQLSRYLEGALKVVVTGQPQEELFIEEATIISVSSFNLIPWLDLLNPTHMVYSIITKQLGYTDYNLVPEHSNLSIEMETYNGPGLDILKLESAPKAKKPPKPKFKLIVMENGKKKGRPKSTSTYEKAMVMAKKLEEKGQTCEIFAPTVSVDSKKPLYVTGMPTALQGELS